MEDSPGVVVNDGALVVNRRGAMLLMMLRLPWLTVSMHDPVSPSHG